MAAHDGGTLSSFMSRCTGRETAIIKQATNVFILFTVCMNSHELAKRFATLAFNNALWTKESVFIMRMRSEAVLLSCWCSLFSFELQFYYRASQPRFILLWQMWDTVDMMFLCKTPSDKTFEPIESQNILIQGLRWFGAKVSVTISSCMK